MDNFSSIYLWFSKKQRKSHKCDYMAHNIALPLLEDIATTLRLFQVISDIKENFHNNKFDPAIVFINDLTECPLFHSRIILS
jgi:hypothetical protein